jgi:hypothetical protein
MDAPRSLPRHAGTWDTGALARAAALPCLSLYAPVARAPSRELADARRFGSLVSEAADQLADAGVPPPQVDHWCEELLGLHATLRPAGAPNGLAAFLNPDGVEAYRLRVPPEPRVLVADHFALRELLYQTALDRGASPRPSDADDLVIELDRILHAATRHGIRRLWTRQRAAIPGRLDPKTGRLVSGERGDVLEALTTLVLRDGGEAYAVLRAEIPRGAAVAAQLSRT